MLIRQLGLSCIDMLFPSDCPACGTGTLKHPLLICRVCLAELASGNAPEVASSRHIIRIFSCRPYSGITRKCITQFKYHRKRRLIQVFADPVRETLLKNRLSASSADVIVSVPIHGMRRRARGFNQAETIGDVLSEMLCVPVSFRNLVKTKNTLPQTDLTGKDRSGNLEGSFSVRFPLELKDKSIMLVDDVVTTGATLEACAVKLLRAGAKSVTGFTLARTLKNKM